MSLFHCAGMVALVATFATQSLACSTLRARAQRQAAEAQAFRTKVPQPGPPATLQAPVPSRTVLDNKLAVYHVRKAGLPLVSMSVVIKSGSAQDPAGYEGLAGFTADMLKMGTSKRDALALAREVEGQGASIYVDADEDALTLSTTALRRNIDTVFGVLVDELTHSQFARSEVERVRQMRLAALAQRDSDPHQSVAQVFRKVLYGNHPYGHTPQGTAAGIKKIGAPHLENFYSQHVRPANAAVLVVGDISQSDALALVRAQLGTWQGAPHAAQGVQPKPATPVARNPELTLVSRPGAVQSQLMVGELAAARDTPDYFPLTLCNAILGGLFNSRINMNLREDKGYTYGAHSSFDFMRERGPFVVSTGVTTAATAAAVHEILLEIDRIRTSDVGADELANAKNRYSLSLPGSFQTVDAIGSMMAKLYLHDLPLDYFQHLPERLAAVTTADIRRVAQAYLHPNKLSIVVVGDEAAVRPGLEQLQRGALQKRDSQGRTLDN